MCLCKLFSSNCVQTYWFTSTELQELLNPFLRSVNQLNQLHGAESFLIIQHALSLSSNSPHIMTTECSLPQLQESVTSSEILRNISYYFRLICEELLVTLPSTQTAGSPLVRCTLLFIEYICSYHVHRVVIPQPATWWPAVPCERTNSQDFENETRKKYFPKANGILRMSCSSSIIKQQQIYLSVMVADVWPSACNGTTHIIRE